MSAQLLEVLFNHDAADKRGSALNLRADAERPLPLPEWKLRADGSVQRSPAAYACRGVVPALLTVGATLRWRGVQRRQIEVRALAVQEPGHPAPLLGELVARSLTIGADGLSGRQLFTLRGGWLAAAPVGVHEVVLRWQWRDQPGQPWTDFALTRHEIYTTLLSPTAPWTDFPFIDANIALPWASVLAIACRWAAGAQTTTDAATLIASQLYFNLGGSRFEYGCAVFGREMYTNSVLALFDCSAFVERVLGGEGNGRFVNCTDCACMVSTLANALGAQLWQSRMGRYMPAFMTRDVRTIGGTRWQLPCGLGLGFMFHEVAWSGLATEFDAVWDASLMVNADPLPFGLPVPLLSANLGFGVAFGGLYRSMIARPLDQLICEPRPEERRCRALM